MIRIPFSKEMESAVIDGIKCCTSRSEAYGSPGVLFSVHGLTYRILDVHPTPPAIHQGQPLQARGIRQS